ncbi:head-tail adaptor protein [Planctomyces sp. SH-PL14]|uniref:phage head completion protein n=1 Tax=Planctomyces sp. SH-PL14 TaxID=1632864 RepID=UPI00078EF127|nr:head-tail adaptor protein [Planctomyces sp. SH-PL14]AMV20412.1 Phage head-tail joining protein [Planctomyces sp. SH-PL14]
MTPAGQRRERPMFQKPITSQAAGEEQETRFEDQFPRWARIVPQEGSESEEGRRITRENTIRVTVINDPDTRCIDQTWRLVWRNRYWNVGSVFTTEDNAEIEIRAMEVKGAA